MPEPTRISDQIFTVPGLFTAEECDQYVALAESIGFGAAPITTAYGPVMNPSVRDNERVMLDDVPRARLLWRRIEPFVREFAPFDHVRPVGVNERLRFYRYDPGQAFRWHRDGFFERLDSPLRERSRLTYMVYLNDDFEGGQTAFVGHDVKPVKGMALVFHHPILHQGAPVKRGRKYVLRTDVMYVDG
jgi:prolyl 4-hydroxylase